MPEMPKELGVTDFVSEIKRVVNYPAFEKLGHVIHHDLQRFIVKSIEGKSTEANDLSHILKKWVFYVLNNYKCCQRFLKT